MSERSRPTIVCLCGSTRFKETFYQQNLRETLAGRIVLSIGCASSSDAELFGGMSPEEWEATKTSLDRLHLAKVELADEVLILDVNGYIGESTARELAYAQSLGKRIRRYSEENPR
jgi:hypothetical protein